MPRTLAISAVVELGNSPTARILLAARIIRHLSRDEKRYGDQLARTGPIFRQSFGKSQRGSPLPGIATNFDDGPSVPVRGNAANTGWTRSEIGNEKSLA